MRIHSLLAGLGLAFSILLAGSGQAQARHVGGALFEKAKEALVGGVNPEPRNRTQECSAPHQ